MTAPAYPSLPNVGVSLEAHTALLRLLKEATEIHERRTTNILDSFVPVRELVELGLAQIRGGDLQSPSLPEFSDDATATAGGVPVNGRYRSGSIVKTNMGAAALYSAPTFIAPTLLNSWVNFGAPYATAGYYKDPFGRVHLKGHLKSGVIGSAAFTLPAGYRPAERTFVATVAHNGASYIVAVLDVNTDGSVTPTVGANGEFVINAISFVAA